MVTKEEVIENIKNGAYGFGTDRTDNKINRVFAWKKFREDLKEIRFDLRHAHFEGTDLRGADLWGVNLSFAHLEGADLRGSLLWDAKLRSAKLKDVKINEDQIIQLAVAVNIIDMTERRSAPIDRLKKLLEEKGVKLEAMATPKQSEAKKVPQKIR